MDGVISGGPGGTARISAGASASVAGRSHQESLGAAGLLVVVLSTSYPLTLFGWTLFGLGRSGIVPQIFTAAGNISEACRGRDQLTERDSATVGPAVAHARTASRSKVAPAKHLKGANGRAML